MVKQKLFIASYSRFGAQGKQLDSINSWGQKNDQASATGDKEH